MLTILVVVSVLSGTARSAVPSHPRDSRDIPNVRTAAFLNVPIGRMLGAS